MTRSALAIADGGGGGFLVKEARVQQQLELLHNKYVEITTIKDALLVQTAAEALAVLTKELDVHERYRNEAEAMIRRCEIRLGEITQRIPHVRRGRHSPPTTQPTKSAILKEANLLPSRVFYAEKMATLPTDEQERLIRDTENLSQMQQRMGLPIRQWVPAKFVDALLAELENRRKRPNDPVLDALRAEWDKHHRGRAFTK